MNERWETALPSSGTITSNATISPTYYHQYLVVASYSLVGGGMPASPVLSYPSLGSQTSQILSNTALGLWIDVGSSYGAAGTLGGSSTNERWQTESATSGTVSATGTLSLVYYHQYFISPYYTVTGDGTPVPPSFSYTAFGTNNSITLTGTLRLCGLTAADILRQIRLQDHFRGEMVFNKLLWHNPEARNRAV